MYAFKLAFKNIISRKSSIVIILFITFAISLLVLFNAIFDGTDHGLEEAFAQSYTGDLVIMPESDFPMSLFGDETPVTGAFSNIPLMSSYTNAKSLVEENEDIEFNTFQVTGAAAINVGNSNFVTALFGIDEETYFELFPSIQIVEGTYMQPGQSAIMLTVDQAKTISEKCGVELHAGDQLRLTSSNGTSFSIRLVTLTAIYDYKVPNAQLNKISLVDAQTVRELIGIDEFYEEIEELDEDSVDLLEQDFDLDSLFDENSEMFTDDSAGQETDSSVYDFDESIFEEAEDESLESTDTAIAELPKSAAWNFIICKVRDGANPAKVISQLNSEFKKREMSVKAVDWRTAAGGTVSLVNYMRLFLNIGLILIMLTGCIVINNALTVQALNRIQETGTLRSIGAKRKFIAKQSFIETALLTITAGILGCLLGMLISNIVSGIRIPLSNQYLMQLFGTSLVIKITGKTILSCMGLSLILTVVGWFFPLRIALNTSPVTAMRSAS